jgi:hypothetical protein
MVAAVLRPGVSEPAAGHRAPRNRGSAVPSHRCRARAARAPDRWASAGESPRFVRSSGADGGGPMKVVAVGTACFLAGLAIGAAATVVVGDTPWRRRPRSPTTSLAPMIRWSTAAVTFSSSSSRGCPTWVSERPPRATPRPHGRGFGTARHPTRSRRSTNVTEAAGPGHPLACSAPTERQIGATRSRLGPLSR